ncbi:MAG: hemolysin family protein [Flavobacteriaceae bacterium]
MNLDLIIILISIFFSAFFSGMEIAFISSNKIYLEIEKKQNDVFSILLKKLTKSPSKFIATMLVGNNIALVVYGLFSGKLILDLIFPEINTAKSIDFFHIFYQTVISAFIILITAEFLPKVMFQIYANRLLKYFSIPAYFFHIILSPITSTLNYISNSVLSKLFKTKQDELRIVFSKDELGNFINDELSNDGESTIIDSEIQFFQNALEFSSVRAREIMIPRAEIISVDRYSVFSTINKKFIDYGLSKILIHRENIDHIVGYVRLQDMFNRPKNIKSIILPVEFIPETMLINDVLNLLTKKRIRIAIVIDEYGGTSGIITKEDIVEELFGEIEDEHDLINHNEKIISQNSYLFSARLEIDYLNEKYNLKIPVSEEYETLGGYIVYNNQNIPKKGEIIKINSIEFLIEEVTETKIETLLVKMKN